MILDTCALLWLADDQEKLTKKTLNEIDNAPVVSISVITGFEIGLKYKSGKLILPVPPEKWFDSVLEHHNISIIPMSLEICIKATELPPIHKDPCDRFIIATALINVSPIVTGDQTFKEYGISTLE